MAQKCELHNCEKYAQNWQLFRQSTTKFGLNARKELKTVLETNKCKKKLIKIRLNTKIRKILLENQVR